ncbi:MAG: low-density lipoprotein receptor class A repeat-containing protein [Candidatus Poseidoniaceae archaeon]
MQRTIQPGPPSKKSKYWKTSGILFAAFFIMMMIDVANDPTYFECNDGEEIPADYVNDGDEDCWDGSDEDINARRWVDDNTDDGFLAAIGSLSCCGSLLFAVLALSARNQKTMMVQQIIPQPRVQTVVQPVIQPVVQPASVPISAQQTPASTQQQTRSRPEDLEKARDFEAAAEEYQRLGMYEEAGRVRAMHLENKDKPMVSIGTVGNTILNDSVMVGGENVQNKCPSCQQEIQPQFNICPFCQHQLK